MFFVSSDGAPPPRVDYQQVFTSLAQQFETQCQLTSRKEKMPLLNSRKEVMSSLKHNPVTGWLEYSKGRQWRRGVESGRSPDGVPDFNAIFKKIKSDFVFNSITATTTVTKPYSMWLVSKSNKPDTDTTTTAACDWVLPPSSSTAQHIAEPFNLIASSSTSSWLQSTIPYTTTDSSSGLTSWLHSSSVGRSEAVRPVETIASMSMSSWLSSSPAKQSQDVKQHDESNTNVSWLHSTTSVSEPGNVQPVEVFNTIAGTSVSSWLSPKGSDSVHDKATDNVSWLHNSSTDGSDPVEMFNTIAGTSFSSWLSPSASCKPAVMDTVDHSSWLHSSDTAGDTFDAIASSDAILWLHQMREHDHTDWLLCNRSSQDGIQWLMPRCK